MKNNQEEILNKYNDLLFMEQWNKYATGNLSSWELKVMCFYYHDHELKDINFAKYGIMDFYKMPEEPIIDKTYERGGKVISLKKISKICGTCIAKNKNKSTVTLLTPTGVVNVKFAKDYFAMFDKQISKKQADGKKKILEKSWFNRGEMILVQGFRSGDDFIAKKYKSTGGHTLYKISNIQKNGDIELVSERTEV